MGYSETVRRKLSEYKTQKFPEFEDGIYRQRKYRHILPKDKKFNNFLKPYREILKKYVEDKELKLHIYFHHLNSSQAMCLNFFYPLAKEQKLEIILDLLGFEEEIVDYETVCFEKDGLEKDDLGAGNNRPTSFDFYFETKSGKRLFFEIKYTENGFGKAEIDASHEKKFDVIYQKHLKPIHPDFRSKDIFLRNYQILRNLIHIDDNSYVIFLFPEGNETIQLEVNRVKTTMLGSAFRDHFFPITWEKILKKADIDWETDNMKKQISDFKEKYL